MRIKKNKLEMKVEKLGDLFKLVHGSGIKNNNGLYSLYGTGGYIGQTNHKQNDGHSFTIGRKGTLDKPLYIKEPYSTIDTAFSTKDFKFDSLFLYRLISTINFNKYSLSSNRPSLTKKIIENIKINTIQNIEQQHNISKILSKQEEQIETIKRLIKNVEKRNQYYSEKLLSGELKLITNEETGQIEFHENTEWKEIILNGNIIKSPLDWEISIFSSYSKFTVGTPIHSNNFNYEKKGLMYLRTGDVWKDASSSKDIAYYDGEASLKFIKKENDYLISLKGYNKKIGEGTLGLVTNFNKQIGIVCDNMYLVTPKENDLVAYTAYVTRMPYIQNIILKSAVGSTARFATKMIDKIEWIFPKNIEYMLSVNQFFQKLDNEVFILEELQKKEEKRFQWMLDNLLSGEYEVIDED